MTPSRVNLITKTCPRCGRSGSVVVSLSDYNKYKNGARIQDAFPNTSPELREQILTGYHPNCWDDEFKF